MRESTDRMTTIVSTIVPGVSKDLAWKIVGILFTNCFEFKLAEIEARALYPLVSVINHSCIPNMRHTNLINELKNEQVEGEIVVMKLEAQRTILEDTELTIRYNDYMMVSWLKNWHEWLRCSQCTIWRLTSKNVSGYIFRRYFCQSPTQLKDNLT